MVSLYERINKQILISKKNNYNSLVFDRCSIKLNTSFNTFGETKSIKAVKLYNLIWLLSCQKPIVESIKTKNIKKKILKSFNICAYLNKKNSKNAFIYFNLYYIYFFQIFYSKIIKARLNKSYFLLQLDNFQFFLKNNSLSQKTKIKVLFNWKDYKSVFFYANNHKILKFQWDTLSQKTKN